MPPALARLLQHRRAVAALFALGVLLGLGTLSVGFFADDYTFLSFLETPSPRQPSTFGLYDFAHGPADTWPLMVRGPFPWWTSLDLKVRFFRPLSSAMFVLDHELFGHSPLGYHVHALLWYALFLGGVVALLRRVLAPPLLVWSLLVFVLNAAHCETVAWLSSRHLLVASSPAVWGLAAHVAYREHGFRAGRWLGPLGLLVGFLGGEAALGVALFWVAYELWGASAASAWRTKLGRCAWPAGIALVYLVAYKIGDYGAAHNAAYFEPLSDPKAFLGVVAQRLPIMLGELFLGVPSVLGTVFRPAPFIVLGALATALVGALLRNVWDAVHEDERRAVKWLGAGSLASLVVAVGAYPGSRLLLLPSIGGSVIVGVILCYGWRKLALSTLLAGVKRGGWILLFALHVVAAPLMFVQSCAMLASVGAKTEAIDLSLDGVLPHRGSNPAKPPNVFVIASDPLAGMYVAGVRAVRAPGTTSGWSVLSMARATHDILRVDDRTIVIRSEKPMLRGSFEGVFRDAAREPLVVGQRVTLEEATVTVLAVEDGFPTAIEVRFIAPLEDDRFRILAWQEERLRPLRVPVGDHAVIPWSPGPTGFF